MDDMRLLIEFHENAKRQGPGSEEETIKALSMIDIREKKDLKILDIGCGSGAQTITLAENISGSVTAVDLYSAFLKKLENTANQKKLNNITTVQCSMEKLPFKEKEFDIIWSEGSVYNMGFENGFKSWKKYIKDSGYLVVTELSWITGNRPEEVEEYWNKEYPGIDTISGKVKIIENIGYKPVCTFVMPEYCWMDNYYNPMKERFDIFLNRNKNSISANEIVENEKKEIEIYEKYKNYYSYVFYIVQNINN